MTLFFLVSTGISQQEKKGPQPERAPQAWQDDVPELAVRQKPVEKLSDGFAVANEVLLLRAQLLELDVEVSLEAMNRIGLVAMDRVTVEMLKSMTRTSDGERRLGAGQALVQIGERAAQLGHREFAGMIGEHLYLSAQEESVRKRAYALFMLLDTEEARRHRID